MLTKDVEKKKRFTTSADASDNLDHPIAFGRDEFIYILLALKIHHFAEIFVSRHVFLQPKYTFYSIKPNFFIDLTLQKHRMHTLQ